MHSSVHRHPLLRELEYIDQGVEYQDIVSWMQKDVTKRCVGSFLDATHIESSPRNVKHLISLVYANADADNLFGGNDYDRIMKREAALFCRRLRAHLDGTETADDFGQTFERATRFFRAWSHADRASMRHDLECTIRTLAADSARSGASVDPPDELLELLERIDPRAAQDARESFSPGRWTSADGVDDLARIVVDTARRAFWDVVRADLRDGKHDSLFGVLGEVHDAMMALIVHDGRRRDELSDKFDVEWLKQRAANDCLTLEDTKALIAYIADTIQAWQAPVDDAPVREWRRTVDDRILSYEGSLDAFVAGHLVDFLAEAHEKLGLIYTRVIGVRDAAD